MGLVQSLMPVCRIIAAAVLLAGIMIADRIIHKQGRDFEQL